MLDLEDAKLDKAGNVKGLEEQIQKLTEAEDTKFLFDAPVQQQKSFKGFQPGAASTEVDPGTELDMSKMTYDELAAYMESHPDTQ